MEVKEVTLNGDRVSLVPMKLAHLDGLCDVGFDEDIWRWTTQRVAGREQMKKYVETALNERRRNVSLPFVTVEKEANKIVGSTRFGNIDPINRRVEIGWTWINPNWQRTSVNTEAKLLMLRHAFEVWNCVRVEFKTDALNERSRRAILRLGAVEEGTLRRHMLVETGRFRDTVYFSVLDSEWPAVKENLEEKVKNAGARGR